jgi:hypothetical protein
MAVVAGGRYETKIHRLELDQIVRVDGTSRGRVVAGGGISAITG